MCIGNPSYDYSSNITSMTMRNVLVNGFLLCSLTLEKFIKFKMQNNF